MIVIIVKIVLDLRKYKNQKAAKSKYFTPFLKIMLLYIYMYMYIYLKIFRRI